MHLAPCIQKGPIHCSICAVGMGHVLLLAVRNNSSSAQICYGSAPYGIMHIFHYIVLWEAVLSKEVKHFWLGTNLSLSQLVYS